MKSYRARLLMDEEGASNFSFAGEHKFVLAEERTFLWRWHDGLVSEKRGR